MINFKGYALLDFRISDVAPVVLDYPYPINQTNFWIHWERSYSSNFNRYEIHVGETKDFTPSVNTLKGIITDIKTTTFQVTGLTARSQREVVVRVVNNDGQYADSNRKWVVTADVGEVIVYQNSDMYCSWPSAHLMNNGDVVVRWSEQNYHYARYPFKPFVYTEYIPQARLNNGEKLFRLNKLVSPDFELSEYKENNCFTKWWYTWGGVFSDKFIGFGNRGNANGVYTIHPMFSYDNLQTIDSIGNPIVTNTEVGGSYVNGFPVKLSNDAILTVFQIHFGNSIEENKAIFYISYDNGLNWEYWSEFNRLQYEVTIFKVSGTFPNEKIWAFVRSGGLSSSGPHLFEGMALRESLDSGQTWSEPRQLFAGNPATNHPNDMRTDWTADKYSNGALIGGLVKKGNRYIISGSRRCYKPVSTKEDPNYCYHILGWSDDEGVTWQQKNIDISTPWGTDRSSGDMGYTSLIDLGDKLRVFYYTCQGKPLYYDGVTDGTGVDGFTNPYIAYRDINPTTLEVLPQDDLSPKSNEMLVLLNYRLPFPLNSAKQIYSTIVLPLYSDDTLTTPDNSAGTLILGQINSRTKYIHNNTTKTVKTFLRATVDGINYDSPPQILQPNESQLFTVNIDLTGVTNVASVFLYAVTKVVN